MEDSGCSEQIAHFHALCRSGIECIVTLCPLAFTGCTNDSSVHDMHRRRCSGQSAQAAMRVSSDSSTSSRRWSHRLRRSPLHNESKTWSPDIMRPMHRPDTKRTRLHVLLKYVFLLGSVSGLSSDVYPTQRFVQILFCAWLCACSIDSCWFFNETSNWWKLHHSTMQRTPKHAVHTPLLVADVTCCHSQCRAQAGSRHASERQRVRIRRSPAHAGAAAAQFTAQPAAARTTGGPVTIRMPGTFPSRISIVKLSAGVKGMPMQLSTLRIA